MNAQENTPAIRFNATPFIIGAQTILALPKQASVQLPSRGMVMVDGTLNNFPFQATLEPDGDGSHWFGVDGTLRKSAKVRAGDPVSLAIKSTKQWSEPELPADLQKALATHPHAKALWAKITPMAHWDWIRWINATMQSETRKRRIEVACSKLQAGMRRPCCFNRSMCTVPEVSKNGVLLKPDQTKR